VNFFFEKKERREVGTGRTRVKALRRFGRAVMVANFSKRGGTVTKGGKRGGRPSGRWTGSTNTLREFKKSIRHQHPKRQGVRRKIKSRYGSTYRKEGKKGSCHGPRASLSA